VAETDPAFLVANHHERCEAEAPAALYDLGDAVNVDELVDELAVALFPFPLASGFTCHNDLLSSSGLRPLHCLEFEAALARGIGQCLDASVVEIAAAVEHHGFDALMLGALRYELPDRLCGIDIGAGFQ